MVALNTSSWTMISYWSSNVGYADFVAQISVWGKVRSQNINENYSVVDFKYCKRIYSPSGSSYVTAPSLWNYNNYEHKIRFSNWAHSAYATFAYGRVDYPDNQNWSDISISDSSNLWWNNVTHNADGTCSITYVATGARPAGDSYEYSDTITLPTIPRASVPTVNKSSITLDGVNSIVITTNRKSSSFTHTVVMSSGSESYTVTGVGASYTWTPSMGKWMPVMGSSSSITATITVTTYNGSTQIGSPQSITVTLNKDTRASTASFDKTAIVLDGTNKFNVTITRAISAFTHTVTYKQTGATDLVVTGVGTSTQFQPGISRMAYCSAVKNAVTVELRTYNSGYQIGSTRTYTIYLYVSTSTYKPTIGTITLTEGNSAVASVMNGAGFVKGLSKLSASIPFGVSDTNYVTLASGTSKLGSQQSNSYTLSGTSATKTVTQTALNSTSLEVTVTDTRGVTASKTQSITLRDYSNLVITSASVQRVNSSGTPSSSGTYCKYTVGVSCHSGTYGSQNNTITLQWRYKKHSVLTWSAWTTLSTTDTGDGTGYTRSYSFSRTVGEGTFQNVQYDVQFRVTDLFMTSTSGRLILYEGIPAYSWGSDHFDVYGELHIHDRTDPTVYTKVSPTGTTLPIVVLTDCNNATQYGTMYRATPDTANIPVNGYFSVYVFPYSTAYRTQVAFSANLTSTRIFVRASNDNGWNAWQEVQYK